jgi:hypothetical protein
MESQKKGKDLFFTIASFKGVKPKVGPLLFLVFLFWEITG